ncbi:right-handed parallel beta-helix repeat-containing protein [Streptomyces aculeolatus]|jgi:hypothetical protein
MARRSGRPHRGTRTSPVVVAGAAAAVLTAAVLTVPGNAWGEPERPAPRAAAGAATQDCGAGTYQAEAVKDGGTWTARHGGDVVYTGDDMLSAMSAAVGSLTPNRTTKERVVVRGDGTMRADTRLGLPSHTALDVCGTINVTGASASDMAPVYARGVTDVEVQHLSVTGTPLYGVFIRNATDVHLGQIDMRLSGGGIGVRVDRYNTTEPTRNVRIDDVYVSGAGSHAVETYGVDGLTIGSVTARDVGESGLLLNETVNADIGTVDAVDAGTGTGYAAFRMANRNGRIGGSYATNVHVDQVIARGGGRGIFCVSESGGAVIDRVDIADTGSNAVLVENCYNVTIAGESGTIAGPGDIRLAARGEFANNRDITLQNVRVTNSAINENPCGENTVVRNVELVNSSQNTC